MNTTFVNYLNELRLTRAAMLLTTTDTPVIEIAGMSGFNNISNFNRAFKMYYENNTFKVQKSRETVIINKYFQNKKAGAYASAFVYGNNLSA